MRHFEIRESYKWLFIIEKCREKFQAIIIIINIVMRRALSRILNKKKQAKDGGNDAEFWRMKTEPIFSLGFSEWDEEHAKWDSEMINYLIYRNQLIIFWLLFFHYRHIFRWKIIEEETQRWKTQKNSSWMKFVSQKE